MKQNNTIFIYSNGRVAALNSANGDIIWELKLKTYINTSVMQAVGSIQLEGDKLYVAVSGIIVCLKAKDGSLIWKNELKGWGYNFVSMANVATDPQAGSHQANASAMTTIIASSSAGT
jgi:outer membrane protein assembly factor BamB